MGSHPKDGKGAKRVLHGAARRLTGRLARRGRNGVWHYPSLEGAMREAGLTEIGKSIANRQANDLSDGIPKGRGKELPSRRVPGDH